MKKELAKLRLWAELDTADYSDDLKWIEMKKKGEELPEDVFEDNNGKYFRMVPSQMSREDEMLFVALRQMKYVKTIRNCVIFFVILAVIAILLLLIEIPTSIWASRIDAMSEYGKPFVLFAKRKESKSYYSSIFYGSSWIVSGILLLLCIKDIFGT